MEVKIHRLGRVEGDGGIEIVIGPAGIEESRVYVYEAKRYIEKALRGRHYSEVPDITSRICGLCPTSYSVVSSTAIEKCLGCEPPEHVVRLRRAAQLCEWVNSHVLHVALLHAPDLVRFGKRDHERTKVELAKTAYIIRKWSKTMSKALVGRAIHPVNIRVGGLWSPPKFSIAKALLRSFDDVLATAKGLMEMVLGLERPEWPPLREGGTVLEESYPLLSQEVVLMDYSGDAMCLYSALEKEKPPYSNAPRLRYKGKAFSLGPIPRYVRFGHKLRSEARDQLKQAGFTPKSMADSIVIRVAELIHALLEIRDTVAEISEYKVWGTECPKTPGEKRVCFAAIEAPRGILYHRYVIGPDGRVIEAELLPPTVANLAAAEEDMKYIPSELLKSRETAEWASALIVRNYDPCISCATR